MPVRSGAIALIPLLLFLALFLGAGAYYTAQGVEMGFYQLRAPVAILPALALAAWLAQRRGVPALDTLLEGMGHPDVVLMCLVFLLAGAFATVSRQIGAVDAVVALGLDALPAALVLPGLFLVAGFVALSIGTSMGTIAAVTPIALGVADATGMDRALVVGAVVGGAMFGDNLSIISDTTIAATRSQGVSMRDKFRENIRFALPAALATMALLALLGEAAPVQAPVAAAAASAWLALPYVLVLILAVAGLNVVLVLAIGIVIAAIFGFAMAPEYGLPRLAGDVYLGYESMIEIVLLSLLIGGLAALTRTLGGLDWIARQIARMTGGRRGRRSGELGIAALAAGSDVFTANNTVAILVSGPVARDIAVRHAVTPRRAASLLDIFACVLQGVLPYGAQILLAASLATLSPLQLAGRIHYCWILGAVAVGFILWPARRVREADAGRRERAGPP